MTAGAAFFDLDGTLLPGSSLFPLAVEMFRRGVLRGRDFARLALDQSSFRRTGTEAAEPIDRARVAALAAIAGRERAEVLEVARSVVRVRLLPKLYPEALALVGAHLRAGRSVFLATAAPEDFALLLAAELSVHGVVATRVEVEDGRYTGRLDGGLNHGARKADRVGELARTAGFDLLECHAYSDSFNDLPLLELVGRPVAVNPDRRLRQVAITRGWPVLDFRRSGRVRSRRGEAVPTPRGSRPGALQRTEKLLAH